MLFLTTLTHIILRCRVTVKRTMRNMKIHEYNLLKLVFMLLMLSSWSAQAQLASNIPLDSVVTPNLKLKPLSILTEYAIQSSPEMKSNLIDVASQTLTWKAQKKSWLDVFNITGTTMYGGGSILDAANNGSSTTYILSDRKSLNANISLGVRILGSDFTNKATKTEIQKLQIDKLNVQRQTITRQIREEVATLYSNLEAVLNSLKFKAENVENQRLALSISEKYFKEGNLAPTEYSSMLTKYITAQEQYEQAKSEAKKLSILLRDLVDAPIYEN